MKTMTVDEFELEVQQILVALRNGQQKRVHLDVNIVNERPVPTPEELASLTQQQREIVERGWSIEMARIFTENRPHLKDEPDPFPRERSPVVISNPFEDENS